MLSSWQLAALVSATSSSQLYRRFIKQVDAGLGLAQWLFSRHHRPLPAVMASPSLSDRDHVWKSGVPLRTSYGESEQKPPRTSPEPCSKKKDLSHLGLASPVSELHFTAHILLRRKQALQSVHTVLSFIAPDPDNVAQKALISACVEVGVKRFGTK